MREKTAHPENTREIDLQNNLLVTSIDGGVSIHEPENMTEDDVYRKATAVVFTVNVYSGVHGVSVDREKG